MSPYATMRLRPVVLLLAAALIPATLSAQETETERAAARDVLRTLDSLEASLNIPAMVARLTGPDAARDAVTARAKELMTTELLAMGDDITAHPEIGFTEHRSVKILTDWLTKHGFDVQTGVAGFPTAFVARYKQSNGAPNLGVIVEYDALRGTKGAFHGDQHSTQGPIGLAAAVALAEYLTRTHTPGSVTVFGTPGEEMMPPVAKTVMNDSGVFNGMDVIVRRLVPIDCDLEYEKERVIKIATDTLAKCKTLMELEGFTFEQMKETIINEHKNESL